ncbi:hypothetical protein RFI_06326 [Reticulomyxa filosa]|uniref:EF-hand domain-containing protein n=1 Tax=Reticulomyxa filosa TaxID=46433 RepID=X6NWV6_RETFI|nr:hypothetical protein RFI_06326 [Reticulomyxa filosa]|eukprot:ETO30800.1 hypothetical protein RFI_06326 [Reticulomyxa filosa]
MLQISCDEQQHNENICKMVQNRIDLDVVANFLYGNTTPQGLWDHLDTKNEGEISIDRLQNLFLAVFVLSIQIEASPNVHAYLGRCQHLAFDYAQKFANNISTNIGSPSLKKQDFIDNVTMLNDMHSNFSSTLLQQIIQDTEKAQEHTKKQSSNSTPAHHTTVPSADQEKIPLQQVDVIEDVASNVAAIRDYCINACTLRQLWAHFMQSTPEKLVFFYDIARVCVCVGYANFMDYTQFDVVVFAALAYFVQQRNPDAPLATRMSLNPLIDQLSMSLLAAYDPNQRGYITYDDFEAFGEYLRDEFGKLRGSILAQDVQQQDSEGYNVNTPNIPTEPLPIDSSEDIQKLQTNKIENEDSSEDSLGMELDTRDINSSPEMKNNNIDLETVHKEREFEDKKEDATDENDLDNQIVESLEQMKEQVDIFLDILRSTTQKLQTQGQEKSTNFNARDLLKAGQEQIEQITADIKEMEIQCNNLQDNKVRYKYAQMINTLDMEKFDLNSKLKSIALQGK